jgi:hypothetical protein
VLLGATSCRKAAPLTHSHIEVAPSIEVCGGSRADEVVPPSMHSIVALRRPTPAAPITHDASSLYLHALVRAHIQRCKKTRIVTLGLGTGRQRMVLEVR